MTNEMPVALENLAIPDATVHFARHFFTEGVSNSYYKKLSEQVNWQQEKIKLFGKEHLMPRLTAWYGDKGYTYSGLHNKPQPWLPVLEELKREVEWVSGHKFNSALLNLYRTGQDSMGWHADDEPELGQEPVIASLSFGGERNFRLKHRTRKDLKPVSISLGNGSLLLMQGATQHHWVHQISKTKRDVEPRINLTFRNVKV